MLLQWPGLTAGILSRRDRVDALIRLVASQRRPTRPIQIGETSVREAVSSEAHDDEKIGVRALNATPYDRRNCPDYLGNFERATGVRPRTKTSHFAVWSDLRARIETRAFLWLSIVLAGNLVAVVMSYRGASTRGRQYLTALTFLLLIAGAEFLVNALADCLDDLGRHLYAFDALFDLILIADLAWLTQMFVTYYHGIGLKKAPAHSH